MLPPDRVEGPMHYQPRDFFTGLEPMLGCVASRYLGCDVYLADQWRARHTATVFQRYDVGGAGVPQVKAIECRDPPR